MDVYVDREGLIYITDQIPRLTVLRDDGTIVGRTRPAFVGPHGMAGDHMGNLYFVETRVPEITKLAPVS
jgi:peptidylglycine monooxygenase